MIIRFPKNDDTIKATGEIVRANYSGVEVKFKIFFNFFFVFFFITICMRRLTMPFAIVFAMISLGCKNFIKGWHLHKPIFFIIIFLIIIKQQPLHLIMLYLITL